MVKFSSLLFEGFVINISEVIAILISLDALLDKFFAVESDHSSSFFEMPRSLVKSVFQ